MIIVTQTGIRLILAAGDTGTITTDDSVNPIVLLVVLGTANLALVPQRCPNLQITTRTGRMLMVFILDAGGGD